MGQTESELRMRQYKGHFLNGKCLTQGIWPLSVRNAEGMGRIRTQLVKENTGLFQGISDPKLTKNQGPRKLGMIEKIK